MNDKQIFIDTNILVYAHDVDAGIKHDLAKEKVAGLWKRNFPPAISIQVLQEFYVNLLRKKVLEESAKLTVISYLTWETISNDQPLFCKGIEFKERWKISFWDALILAAAKKAKAEIIWSENFKTAENYDGIKIVNRLI